MNFLETGELLPGAVTVKHETKCQVWRGIVRMRNNKRVMAYVKHVPQRELVVECIAAILGRSLSLPIPRPILVSVIPVSAPVGSRVKSTGEVFFGSERVKQPDLAQWCKNEKHTNLMMRKLQAWPKAIQTGCFDEWIANCDRHWRNVLYDGGRDFVLIDHSHAIPRGQAADEPSSKNTLAEIVRAGKSNPDLIKIEDKAHKHIAKYAEISIDSLLSDTLKKELNGFHDSEELMSFLADRLGFVGQIISHRFGNSQEDLVNDIAKNKLLP